MVLCLERINALKMREKLELSKNGPIGGLIEILERIFTSMQIRLGGERTNRHVQRMKKQRMQEWIICRNWQIYLKCFIKSKIYRI